MLEPKIYCNNIGYVATREYLYRFDVISGETIFHRLSDDDKLAIRSFAPDPYNDLGTWEFLDKIFNKDMELLKEIELWTD